MIHEKIQNRRFLQEILITKRLVTWWQPMIKEDKNHDNEICPKIKQILNFDK